MNDEIRQPFPANYEKILDATNSSGFTMASEVKTCALLRTLAASKPGGRFLELGTGTGLSTAWILDGMDSASTLISIDNEAKYLDIAQQFLGNDPRLELILTDGADWVNNNLNQKFDYIFADTWHGKYLLLDEVLAMLNPGALYIIDDMLPQPNWPDGHEQKAMNLIQYLEHQNGLHLVNQSWASGIVIGVRKQDQQKH